GPSALDSSVDEDEAFAPEDDECAEEVDPRRLRAAQRAWDLWHEEDESEEAQASQDAAITQSLLGRALSTLGGAGDDRPIQALSLLLRYEPALTPQIVAYIGEYAETGSSARTKIRSALDEVVDGNILSTWQKMWLA